LQLGKRLIGRKRVTHDISSIQAAKKRTLGNTFPIAELYPYSLRDSPWSAEILTAMITEGPASRLLKGGSSSAVCRQATTT
jgi:hypothetical protein